MTTARYQELALAIGQWAEKNFDVFDPSLGVLEEIGETAHCLLKHKQGIRGFENKEFFLGELADGIADTAIYCLHSVHLRQVELVEAYLIAEGSGPYSRTLLGYLGQLAGRLVGDEISGPNGELHSDILKQLSELAACYGIDFDAKLELTWAKVSKRDWRVNPANAAQVAASV